MRRFAVIALVNVVLAGAAAAYSTASTSASLASKPGPVAISAVTFRGSSVALGPGESVRVMATLTNNTASRLGVDAVRIEGSVANLPRGCRSSWFRFTRGNGPAAVVAGNGGTAAVSGTLTLVDAATDQSACAGAAPVLTLHAIS
jgi:hypothetical protein